MVAGSNFLLWKLSQIFGEYIPWNIFGEFIHPWNIFGEYIPWIIFGEYIPWIIFGEYVHPWNAKELPNICDKKARPSQTFSR